MPPQFLEYEFPARPLPSPLPLLSLLSSLPLLSLLLFHPYSGSTR
jgi:hypothetical protein